MARAAITLATNEFLKFAEAESSAGSMEDALKRLKHLRSAAHIFRAAIEERAVNNPTRGYVDDWLEMSYERLNPGDRANQYVANLSADLARFLDACDLTLQRRGGCSAQLLARGRCMGGLDTEAHRDTKKSPSAGRSKERCSGLWVERHRRS